MKLTLNHTQRQNLHVLLGAQAADVESIRAILACAGQDCLCNNSSESIEPKREAVGGEE
jgi:hypothetical protein